jgi:hypothetical protein
MLFFDCKYVVRNLLVMENVKNNDVTSVDALLINVLPYAGNKGVEIKDLNEMFVFNRTEPEVKNIPTVNEAEFIGIRALVETQVVNEINRKLWGRYGDARIEDIKDINEMVKIAAEDADVAKFLQSINFKDKLDAFSKIKKEDLIEQLGLDNVKVILYPNLVKAIVIKEDMVPKNKHLQAGKMYKLHNRLRLYSLLEEKGLFEFDKDYEIIVFAGDNEYIINKSIYGYPVIRRINIDTFFKCDIWKPEF